MTTTEPRAVLQTVSDFVRCWDGDTYCLDTLADAILEIPIGYEQAACEEVENTLYHLRNLERKTYAKERGAIANAIAILAPLPKPEQPPVEASEQVDRLRERSFYSRYDNAPASEQGEVTQSDREAAEEARCYQCNKDSLTEAFSRHRLTAIRTLEAEVARLSELLSFVQAERDQIYLVRRQEEASALEWGARATAAEAEVARLRKSRDDWEKVAREAQADYETEMARATAAEEKLEEAREVGARIIAAFDQRDKTTAEHIRANTCVRDLRIETVAAMEALRTFLSPKEPS